MTQLGSNCSGKVLETVLCILLCIGKAVFLSARVGRGSRRLMLWLNICVRLRWMREWGRKGMLRWGV